MLTAHSEYDRRSGCTWRRTHPCHECETPGLRRGKCIIGSLIFLSLQVAENVLEKVIEWCSQHKDDTVSVSDDEDDSLRTKTTDICEWDRNFMMVDQDMLFEIILAANYLDIKNLLDLGCKTVANMIKGKSPEEIRRTFNIENDFTPEEEEQIKRENEWAEDR